MLTLPIKKKWFDMIMSGEKKEEYREIKPYYISRFQNLWTDTPSEKKKIRFRNGYNGSAPSCIATVSLRTGTGRTDWGAEPGIVYYVLNIHSIEVDEF